MKFGELSQRKKVIIAGIAGLLVIVLVLLLVLLGRQDAPVPKPSPSDSPFSEQVRRLGDDKFAPRPREQNTANVDIGVRTVGLPEASPTPVARARVVLAADPIDYQQLLTPSPAPSALPQETATPVPLAPLPLPVLTPPKFTPLPPPPAPEGKELVVVYAKGEAGKRQIYLRAVERDQDDQLVSDVFDDFSVSMSSSAQKVAFYSNEQGPSDETKARTKLKVVDLATKKVTTIVSGLPGSWPVAWSPDGKRIAIPTANSIFIADVESGTTLQLPTAKYPGGIVWSPDSRTFYFQIQAKNENWVLFMANAITAQSKKVTGNQVSEHDAAPSPDGSKLSFLRDQQGGGPASLVVRNLSDKTEETMTASSGALSYLWNLDQTQLIFIADKTRGKVNILAGNDVKTVEGVPGATLISFDRDYDHVFLLGDDADGKALYSLNLKTGQAEKVKAGLEENLPPISQ